MKPIVNKKSHDDIIVSVRQMYKEQELVLRTAHKSQNLALLTDDADEKKRHLGDADRALDTVQKMNFEIRRFMETNPLT